MSKKLFLDLDGVLTDFQREVLRRHGRQNQLMYTDIRWNFYEQLEMTAKECWSICDTEFWANLPWTPEGEALLAGLERIVPRERICILTSSALGGMDGKELWIKKHIPEYKDNFLMGSAKWATSHCGAALVDDSDVNCGSFLKDGGMPILVPRPWNVLKSHTNPDGSFKLRPLLKQVREWWNAA